MLVTVFPLPIIPTFSKSMMVIQVLLSSEAVSWSEVDKVTNSIGKQREHHRVKTFKEEFL
jgi:hypothetical protein